MDNEFSLARAIAGDPIETMGKTTALFVAYRPTAEKCKQLIMQIGTDIVMYHANGSYYSSNEHCSYNLRMKSVAKQIDWSKLPVDTLITLGSCAGKAEHYFYSSSFSSGMVRYYRDGMTSKTADHNLDVFAINPSEVQISPDQPWTVWKGGECPIPDGLEYGVIVRYGECFIPTNAGCKLQHIWVRSKYPNQVHLGHEVIAYRLTGKVLNW